MSPITSNHFNQNNLKEITTCLFGEKTLVSTLQLKVYIGTFVWENKSDANDGAVEDADWILVRTPGF